MERNVSQSKSAKIMLITKQWIDGLNDEEKYNCLNHLKDFKVIKTKSKSKSNTYAFEDLSADIEILVQNAKNGKCLCFYLI